MSFTWEQELSLAAKPKKYVSLLSLQASSQRWSSFPAADEVLNRAYLTLTKYVGVIKVTTSQEIIVLINIISIYEDRLRESPYYHATYSSGFRLTFFFLVRMKKKKENYRIEFIYHHNKFVFNKIEFPSSWIEVNFMVDITFLVREHCIWRWQKEASEHPLLVMCGFVVCMPVWIPGVREQENQCEKENANT